MPLGAILSNGCDGQAAPLARSTGHQAAGRGCGHSSGLMGTNAAASNDNDGENPGARQLEAVGTQALGARRPLSSKGSNLTDLQPPRQACAREANTASQQQAQQQQAVNRRHTADPQEEQEFRPKASVKSLISRFSVA